MKFLSYDSPLMGFMRIIVDYVLVGILWIVFCIPVFTCGAATTAALLTVEISIHKEEGRILATFWKWFRKEFKEATLLWLLWFLIQCLVTANIWLVNKIQLVTWLQALVYVASGVVFCWSQFWFGYLSRFDDKIKVVIGNTFRMALSNSGYAILILIISVVHIVAVVLLFICLPPFLLLVPGSYLFGYTSVIRKIFAKYLPQADTEECLEKIQNET